MAHSGNTVSVYLDGKEVFDYRSGYAHHMLNPQESYYQPRLRNVLIIKQKI